MYHIIMIVLEIARRNRFIKTPQIQQLKIIEFYYIYIIPYSSSFKSYGLVNIVSLGTLTCPHPQHSLGLCLWLYVKIPM